MSRPQQTTLERDDVVAVRLPPGTEWLDIIAETWEAGAALFPLDHRLPEPMAAELLHRARPTVIRDADGTNRLDGEPADEDDALILHTSGTSDGPKLVRLSRPAVRAAVSLSSDALGATSEDPWLGCLPVAHVGGLLVVLRGVLLGAPVEVLPRFDPDAIAATDGAAFTSLVPTMLGRLLDAGIDLARFRAILIGGAALSPDVRDRAERQGAHVVETYGLTESCGGVVYDGHPLEGTEVRVRPDDEIELRGPTLLSGYRPAGGPPLSEDGWLRTGDAGKLDERGRLRTLGRLDDVIVTGGEKVSPGEVEAVVLQHAAVLDAAVAGLPDPEWGDRVVAWIVPVDPSDPPTLDELREAVAAVLPRHAAPRELRVVERLPMTFSGKVRRAALPRD